VRIVSLSTLRVKIFQIFSQIVLFQNSILPLPYSKIGRKSPNHAVFPEKTLQMAIITPQPMFSFDSSYIYI